MADKNQKTAPGKSVQGVRDDRSDLVESDTDGRTGHNFMTNDSGNYG